MKVAHVAQVWQQVGVAVIPILANQTKRPAVRWGEYQVQAPSLGQVDEWWGNGKQFGLALICGQVSGNLEMLEIEGRATDGDSMTEIMNRVDELGAGDTWDLLMGPHGYSEMSPSGGIHFLYRISDHAVPGNTKIAQDRSNLVLAETRGEGGYVIVAPTPGQCHPTGEPWTLINGMYGQLPVITWEQRCLLHQALGLALDADGAVNASDATYASTALALTPAPPVPVATSTSSLAPGGAGLSPGDHYEATTDWAEILEPHGWSLESKRGPTRHWTRPGKNRRDGSSATTGHASDRDRLYVFTTSSTFASGESYTKFAAYTILNFGGNYHMAAGELRRMGYGEAAQELDTLPSLPPAPAEDPKYPVNDTGNSMYLFDYIRDHYLYVSEQKEIVHWNGKKWTTDRKSTLEYAFNTMIQEKADACQKRGDEVGFKWWTKAGNRSRIEAAIKGLRALPGFTALSEEMDQDNKVINLQNGIYDLATHELSPHDPERRLTKVMAVAYDPDATCPNFNAFMEKVLPDAGMRGYVQRALGYTLLGEADQRSLFLICGPSGTGKSTLMSAMELVFGDYGTSAPSGTLRAPGRENSAPSNDLHTLMGKRFVSTSETNEHTAYNEDLIKRLTGRDTISSRRLYQDFQHWSPRCSIWLATNHPPKFSSDDDAIWRRAKIVPFTTVLLGEGQISDFAHNVLAQERDGILNWLLAGLQDYQRHGLGEPQVVMEAAREVRLQSDPVARFVEDRTTDGVLETGEGLQIRSSELYSMYVDWARQTGERALGNRRFVNRLASSLPNLDHVRIQGNHFWRGVGRVAGVGVRGMIWSPD